MKLLFVTLCISVVVPNVYSLRCYQCATPLGEGRACEDPAKNNAPVAQCFSSDLVCSTYVIKAPNDFNLLNRGCLDKNGCSALENAGANLVKCETCATDLCNKQTVHGGSGAAVIPSLILIGCVTIFASLYSYH